MSENQESIWSVELLGVGTGFISFIPVAFPTGEAEAAAADNFLFPDGETGAVHSAHLIVALTFPAVGAPEACLALTKLACAGIEAFRGTAVYWGPGGITNRSDVFLELGAEATLELLPLYLWIRFQLFRPDAEHIGLYTCGLSQFGLMEIEVDNYSRDPASLLELVYNVSSYLIESGPVIKDGDTVGGDESQRLKVTFGSSMVDPTRQAYRIRVT